MQLKERAKSAWRSLLSETSYTVWVKNEEKPESKDMLVKTSPPWFCLVLSQCKTRILRKCLWRRAPLILFCPEPMHVSFGTKYKHISYMFHIHNDIDISQTRGHYMRLDSKTTAQLWTNWAIYCILKEKAILRNAINCSSYFVTQHAHLWAHLL